MNRPRRGHLLGEERMRRDAIRSSQKRRQRLISPFLSALLVLTLIGGYFSAPSKGGRVLAATVKSAAHVSKLSDDLRAAIQKSPMSLVPVIISSSTKPSNSLWSAIVNGGGSYQRNFNRLPAVAVKGLAGPVPVYQLG